MNIYTINGQWFYFNYMINYKVYYAAQMNEFDEVVAVWHIKHYRFESRKK
jgi:hypothetical protein